AVRSCPRTFNAGAFSAAHPGLFAATGWAHHPYSLTTAPNALDVNKDDATLSGVPRLTRTLDRAQAVYHQHPHMPIWMTEYGYQTAPPDPTIGIPWARQAAWLDEADWLAFSNPRIASFAQFLLVDDGALRQYKPSDPRYWGSFQTGLITAQGRRKPAYAAFEPAVWVSPSLVRRGHRVTVFGQQRAGGARCAHVQFRTRGAKRWKTVDQLAPGPLGFVSAWLRARASGSYRLVWSSNGSPCSASS